MKNHLPRLAFAGALAALSLAFAAPASALPVNQATTPAKEGGTQFTTTISDLPLMPGLKTVGDQDVLFDTAQGRIAETTAQGAVTPAAVDHFYDRSLPQLGWKAAGAHRWRRGKEQLSIATSASGDDLTVVKFSVEPIAGRK
ncbi:MAG TPA: hypothetical protein VMV79_03480 [Alphaproteobacteria bacterium]|nr:hypothetical protein [Alphaproteobacteria bacterium]